MEQEWHSGKVYHDGHDPTKLNLIEESSKQKRKIFY